mmetsp:Transcript_21991/g.67671  ORF Transcript_21991/g.67671 Transcript_21991/m.67671 type:complete len:300 (+) Transcript_21991:158-1057(+)
MVGASRPRAAATRGRRLLFLIFGVPARTLRHANGGGCHLDDLVLADVFDGIVEGEFERGRETFDDAFVGGAHVGKLLLLADVDAEVAGALVDADDHVFVDGGLGAGEELAAVLGAEEAVGGGFAGLEGEERALFGGAEVAGEGFVVVEVGVDDGEAARGREQVGAEADGAARGNEILDVGVVAGLGAAHVLHFALALVQEVDDGGRVLLGNLDLDHVEGLGLDAVDGLDDDFWGADLELEALAAHGLDEDREVQGPAAGDHEGVGAARVVDLQRDVAVEFLHEAVPDDAGRELVALAAG